MEGLAHQASLTRVLMHHADREDDGARGMLLIITTSTLLTNPNPATLSKVRMITMSDGNALIHISGRC